MLYLRTRALPILGAVSIGKHVDLANSIDAQQFTADAAPALPPADLNRNPPLRSAETDLSPGRRPATEKRVAVAGGGLRALVRAVV